MAAPIPFDAPVTTMALPSSDQPFGALILASNNVVVSIVVFAPAK